MLNNVVTAIVLLLIIGVGIGYAIYSDPERREHLLFDQALEQFSNNVEELEQQFQTDSSLPEINKMFSLDFIDSSNSSTTIELRMTVQDARVTLQFGEGDTALANQTIVLEPYVKNEQIRWKCLGGSVLLRFRSKACRLGLGIAINQFSAPTQTL